MEINRNQTHYIIMTVIYDELNDYLIGGGKTFRDPKELIEELCEEEFAQVDDFIKHSISCALNNYSSIKQAYIPFLKGWEFNRLPLLTQSVLLMSYSHFYYVEKVDKKVVINIAVNLAKKYIDEKQAKFINAILDKVLK